MFTKYVEEAMANKARYEYLQEDGVYFGTIDGFQGVWADGATKEECEQELREVLEEWLLIKIRRHESVPANSAYDLNALIAA